MSADRVSTCPKCLAKARKGQENAQEKLKKAYGKVPLEKYKKLEKALEKASQELHNVGNFAQYFEAGMSDEGQFSLRYSGHCVTCGFSFEYDHKEKASLNGGVTMADFEYVDAKDYEVLYAHYIDGMKTKEMVDYAGNLRGKSVVDLCAGGGRLTRAVAKKKPGTLRVVDESAGMIAPLGKLEGVVLHIRSVGFALPQIPLNSIDVAFCQQGVNYWLDSNTAHFLNDVLKRGGLFIFNTFNTRPSVEPRVKEYPYKGRTYLEIAWLQPVGDCVYHVQYTPGYPPHKTSFNWISPEKFRLVLSPYFRIKEHVRGGTTVYVCKKK